MDQTVSLIVNQCPVSRLHYGGLQRLHSADEIAGMAGRNSDESAHEIRLLLLQLSLAFLWGR